MIAPLWYPFFAGLLFTAGMALPIALLTLGMFLAFKWFLK